LDDVPVVYLTGLDRFEDGLGDATLVKPVLHLFAEAFDTNRAIVEGGDVLVAPVIRQEFGGDLA
jgi:hypothetical protein